MERTQNTSPASTGWSRADSTGESSDNRATPEGQSGYDSSDRMETDPENASTGSWTILGTSTPANGIAGRTSTPVNGIADGDRPETQPETDRNDLDRSHSPSLGRGSPTATNVNQNAASLPRAVAAMRITPSPTVGILTAEDAIAALADLRRGEKGHPKLTANLLRIAERQDRLTPHTSPASTNASQPRHNVKCLAVPTKDGNYVLYHGQVDAGGRWDYEYGSQGIFTNPQIQAALPHLDVLLQQPGRPSQWPSQTNISRIDETGYRTPPQNSGHLECLTAENSQYVLMLAPRPLGAGGDYHKAGTFAVDAQKFTDIVRDYIRARQ